MLHALWTGAGLHAVETREIIVHRTFADFDDYWETMLGAPSAGRLLTELPAERLARIRGMLLERLPAPDADGRITTIARANAVKGRVPR